MTAGRREGSRRVRMIVTGSSMIVRGYLRGDRTPIVAGSPLRCSTAGGRRTRLGAGRPRPAPNQIDRLLVVVTGGAGIAAAILAVSVFVEAHDCRLRREALLLGVGALDGPDQVLAPLGIG